MKRISIDNGNTYISPKEAIEQIGFDVIVNAIDIESANRAHTECPETEEEWLELVLRDMKDDLIIG